MDTFNFFFGFYGLVLGLSVAEVAAGMARRLNVRDRRPLGLLTPALALFVLLDITSFWIWGWSMRATVTVSWGLMYGALLVATTYYLAASLVFPRDGDDDVELDAHYWRNKRLVVAGIGFANILMVAYSLKTVPDPRWSAIALSQGLYFGALGTLLFSRWRRVDGIALSMLILFYLTIPLEFWPQQFGAAVGGT